MQVIDDGDPASVMSTSTRSIAGTLKTIWIIGNGNHGTRALFAGSTPPQLGTDKAYDVREFVDDLRDLNITPHIAQKIQSSLGDRRSHDAPSGSCDQPAQAHGGAVRLGQDHWWSREAHAARGRTLEIQVYSDDGCL